MIDIGDKVNIFFTSSDALFDATIKWRPTNIGESWFLETTDVNGKIHEHAVLVFERMDKIEQGAQTNDEPISF